MVDLDRTSKGGSLCGHCCKEMVLRWLRASSGDVTHPLAGCAASSGGGGDNGSGPPLISQGAAISGSASATGESCSAPDLEAEPYGAVSCADSVGRGPAWRT